MRKSGFAAKVGILVTVLLIGTAILLHGQPSASATYKQESFCIACHKTPNAPIITSWQKSAHANALGKTDDPKSTVKLLPPIDPNCPIQKDKVAYILGIGVKKQAYIGADMKTLPAEWNVAEKTLKPTPQVDATTECIGCHVTGYDPTAKTWVSAGVGCQMCHGPGSDHIMSKPDAKKTTIVQPKTLTPQLRADICGQCHSVGRDISKKYAFPIGFRPGMALATKFVDAKPTKHAPQQQYSELIQSAGHWKNGVVCDTCHEPHGVSTLPNQLRKPINDLCLGCHTKLEGAQHQPENLKTNTCATCHMPDGSHFFRKPEPKN